MDNIDDIALFRFDGKSSLSRMATLVRLPGEIHYLYLEGAAYHNRPAVDVTGPLGTAISTMLFLSANGTTDPLAQEEVFLMAGDIGAKLIAAETALKNGVLLQGKSIPALYLPVEHLDGGNGIVVAREIFRYFRNLPKRPEDDVIHIKIFRIVEDRPDGTAALKKTPLIIEQGERWSCGSEIESGGRRGLRYGPDTTYHARFSGALRAGLDFMFETNTGSGHDRLAEHASIIRLLDRCKNTEHPSEVWPAGCFGMTRQQVMSGISAGTLSSGSHS